MMSMSLHAAPQESPESLRRRARVISYRIARGELVIVPAHDPVAEILFDAEHGGWFRVAPGNAAGAIPEVM